MFCQLYKNNQLACNTHFLLVQQYYFLQQYGKHVLLHQQNKFVTLLRQLNHFVVNTKNLAG